MKKNIFPILYAHDLPRLITFYRDLIGMTESFRFPNDGDPAYVTVSWGDGSLGMGTYDVTPGLEARDLRLPKEGRGFELCIYVPDVDAVVARLQREGIDPLVAPMNQPWGERLAYVRDPEGNTIMLTAELQADHRPPPITDSFARVSPFSGLKFRGEGIDVEVDGAWHRLTAVNGVAVERLVAFAKEKFGGRWQKRIAEDLVEVLTGVGVNVGTKVDLMLEEMGSNRRIERRDVPLTEENRRRVKETWERS